jgi:predicted acetyltransferase
MTPRTPRSLRSPRTHYGPPADERELIAYADLVGIAFGANPEEVRRKIAVIGPGPIRLHRAGGSIVAGLLAHECAQWFGGRKIPMAAIAAVTTAPQSRAGGGATLLMRAMLHEMHRRGIALSALYPATRTLYRRVGYEMAGGRYEVTLRPREVLLRERDLPVREAGPKDVPAIGRLFGRSVARDYGPLDWGSPGWQHSLRAWREPHTCYAVCAGKEIEGYLCYLIARKDRSLTVLDFFASTPRAARRLLTLLCDHGAQIDEAKWPCRPNEPMLMLLQEGTHQVNRAAGWMLRVIDVPAALAQRGYAPGAEGTLHLDVRDDIVAANKGRFVLEVSGGRGRVRRGGRGAIRLDVRGLAALFSGHVAARDLQAWTGYVEAPARQMAMLEAVFPPGLPWMAARF